MRAQLGTIHGIILCVSFGRRYSKYTATSDISHIDMETLARMLRCLWEACVIFYLILYRPLRWLYDQLVRKSKLLCTDCRPRTESRAFQDPVASLQATNYEVMRAATPPTEVFHPGYTSIGSHRLRVRTSPNRERRVMQSDEHALITLESHDYGTIPYNSSVSQCTSTPDPSPPPSIVQPPQHSINTDCASAEAFARKDREGEIRGHNVSISAASSPEGDFKQLTGERSTALLTSDASSETS